ncbi:uncharacterized protein LTR77_000131 [Saxophila tyrrhenica]|uniref:Uncharacterized protein n=1 Tax=Saxophila tyrrhenica TaxID=1690608 RepID=A0AAV9PRN0_9PEZI|nr:hypothetical protein LTR77_000131 [Saxophila tyrrhenica]
MPASSLPHDSSTHLEEMFNIETAVIAAWTAFKLEKLGKTAEANKGLSFAKYYGNIAESDLSWEYEYDCVAGVDPVNVDGLREYLEKIPEIVEGGKDRVEDPEVAAEMKKELNAWLAESLPLTNKMGRSDDSAQKEASKE